MKTNTENMLKTEKTRGKTRKTIEKQKLEHEENRRKLTEKTCWNQDTTKGKTRKTSKKQR